MDYIWLYVVKGEKGIVSADDEQDAREKVVDHYSNVRYIDFELDDVTVFNVRKLEVFDEDHNVCEIFSA